MEKSLKKHSATHDVDFVFVLDVAIPDGGANPERA